MRCQGFPPPGSGRPHSAVCPDAQQGGCSAVPGWLPLKQPSCSLNDRFCHWKSSRFLGLEDRKYPRGQVVSLWVRILPGKVRCSDSGCCSGRRGPALPEVGTCCRCAGSRSVVRPHQCFRELSPPGLRENARFPTCQPVPFRMYRGDKSPLPQTFLHFTLSSSPWGKQRPNLWAGKGRWSVPSLLLGWRASRQGCASIPSRCCSRGWMAPIPIPAAALTGTGDSIWERGGGFPQAWLAPFSSSTAAELRSALPPTRTLPSFPKAPGILRSLRNTAGSGFSSSTL